MKERKKKLYHTDNYFKILIYFKEKQQLIFGHSVSNFNQFLLF